MRASLLVRSPRLQRIASVVQRWDWFWLLLAAPALLFPSPTRSLALLIIVGLWVAAWIATGMPLPRTPLNLAILVLLVTVLVSLGATASLENSLAKITGIILGVAGYYVLVHRLTSDRAFGWGLVAYALVGAAFAGVGLLGTDWLLKFPLLDRVIGRLPGLIRGLPGVEEGLQPNYVAGALVLFFPVQLALLLGQARHRTPIWRLGGLAALTGLTGLTLVLTQSRGGALGLAVGLSLWLAWHGRRTRWLLLGLLAIAGLGLALAGPDRVVAWLQDLAGRNLLTNTRARVELWARALTAIQAFPLTGLGLNGFRRALPVLFPMFTLPPEFDISHAHNQFLQAALDLGLPGLVAFVALVVGAFTLLAAARRRTRRFDHRLLAEGLTAALAAQLAFGLTDAIAFGARVHVFFWGTLAYGVCLYRQTLAEPAPPQPTTR